MKAFMHRVYFVCRLLEYMIIKSREMCSLGISDANLVEELLARRGVEFVEPGRKYQVKHGLSRSMEEIFVINFVRKTIFGG